MTIDAIIITKRLPVNGMLIQPFGADSFRLSAPNERAAWIFCVSRTNLLFGQQSRNNSALLPAFSATEKSLPGNRFFVAEPSVVN